jgi:hypothetical protein
MVPVSWLLAASRNSSLLGLLSQVSGMDPLKLFCERSTLEMPSKSKPADVKEQFWNYADV